MVGDDDLKVYTLMALKKQQMMRQAEKMDESKEREKKKLLKLAEELDDNANMVVAFISLPVMLT